MALWQVIVHLRIHAKILVQESRSHWFLNRNRIAPFPCRSTYLKDILHQLSSHLINWKEGGSRHVEIRSILGWIMFDRSDLTEIAGLMWAHTHPYHYYLQIYRFTEVSPCPMANNVLCVVYSNKKIAASAPGWVSRNGPLGTGATHWRAEEGCGHIADYTTPSPATLPRGGVTMGANEPCQDTIIPEGGPGSSIRSLLSVVVFRTNTGYWN